MLKDHFSRSTDYRYRNEGDKKQLTKTKVGKNKRNIIELKKSQKNESGSPAVPLAPQRKRSKKPLSTKPKPTIEQIDESDPEWTIIKLNKQKMVIKI